MSRAPTHFIINGGAARTGRVLMGFV